MNKLHISLVEKNGEIRGTIQSEGDGVFRFEALALVIEKLAALLPGRFTPSPAVAACVKPALDRNRGATEAAAQTPVS